MAVKNLECLVKHSTFYLRDFNVNADGELALASRGQRVWRFLQAHLMPTTHLERIDEVKAVVRRNLIGFSTMHMTVEELQTISFYKREISRLLGHVESHPVLGELRTTFETCDREFNFRDDAVKQALDNLQTIAECSHLHLRNFTVNDQGRLVAHASILSRAWACLSERLLQRRTYKRQEARVRQVVLRNLQALSVNSSPRASWSERKIERFMTVEAKQFNPLIEELKEEFRLQGFLQPRRDWGVHVVRGRVEYAPEEFPQERQPAGRLAAWMMGRRPEETVRYLTPKAGSGNRSIESFRIFLATQANRILRLVTSGHFAPFFSLGETAEQIYARDRLPKVEMTGEMEVENLGHATLLVKFNKGGHRFNLLADPTFHDLNPLIYPRMTEHACTVSQLPCIDAVMISHDHRDHCDERALKELLRYQPVMIVPKDSRHLFEKMGFAHIVEMEWGDEITFSQADQTVRFASVPGDHWSGRHGFDNHFASVQGGVLDGRVYVAGDTAKLPEAVIRRIHTAYPDISVHVQPAGPNHPWGDLRATHMSFTESLRSYMEGVRAKAAGRSFAETLREVQLTFYHHNMYELGLDRFDEASFLWAASVDYVVRGIEDEIGADRSAVVAAQEFCVRHKETLPPSAQRDIDALVEEFGRVDVLRALLRAEFPRVGAVAARVGGVATRRLAVA